MWHGWVWISKLCIKLNIDLSWNFYCFFYISYQMRWFQIIFSDICKIWKFRVLDIEKFKFLKTCNFCNILLKKICAKLSVWDLVNFPLFRNEIYLTFFFNFQTNHENCVWLWISLTLWRLTNFFGHVCYFSQILRRLQNLIILVFNPEA